MRVGKCDAESAILADRHYSRQSVGSPQFMPPGKTIVLRNSEGTVVFGWLWQDKRDDGQRGFNCSIFRNESNRQSSSIIREAEELARMFWGDNRMFTYVDASNIRPQPHKFRKPRVPGRCFLKAGWKFLVRKNGKPQRSTNGLYLLVKLR